METLLHCHYFQAYSDPKFKDSRQNLIAIVEPPDHMESAQYFIISLSVSSMIFISNLTELIKNQKIIKQCHVFKKKTLNNCLVPFLFCVLKKDTLFIEMHIIPAESWKMYLSKLCMNNRSKEFKCLKNSLTDQNGKFRLFPWLINFNGMLTLLGLFYI